MGQVKITLQQSAPSYHEYEELQALHLGKQKERVVLGIFHLQMGAKDRTKQELIGLCRSTTTNLSFLQVSPNNAFSRYARITSHDQSRRA